MDKKIHSKNSNQIFHLDEGYNQMTPNTANKQDKTGRDLLIG